MVNHLATPEHLEDSNAFSDTADDLVDLTLLISISTLMQLVPVSNFPPIHT